MKLKSLLLSLLVAGSTLVGCTDDEAKNDIVSVLKSNPSLSTLATAIAATPGLEAELAASTNVTLFAPSNTALEALAATGITGTNLTNLLKYHVVTEKLLSSDFTAANDTVAKSTLLTGAQVFITVSGTTVSINGSRALSNAVRSGTTGIANFKGNALVTTANIAADNGVIHIIDSILFPDAELTVLEAALKRYSVNRAAGAVVLAGLATSTSPLQGAGPITLLGPVNPPNGFTPSNAFALIDAAGINLAADPAGLVATLYGHVIPGDRAASSFVAGTTVNTAFVHPSIGQHMLVVLGTSPTVTFRSAWIPSDTPGVSNFTVPVVQADIVCKNGRLHLIGNLALLTAPSASAQ